VLAGQPNVTTSESNWQQAAERHGVTIHRVRHTTLSKRNMLLKGVNFLSFVNACRRQIHTLPQPDVVVFETDPFLLPFVADSFRKKTGCRVVGYLQDIYPDVAVALGKVSNNWPIRKLRSALFAVYRRADRMVVLSRDMKQLLLDDGIAEDRVSVIPNWADTDAIQPVEGENRFRKKFGLEDKFVCMYSGNLGLTQRLEEFVEAAAILRDDQDIRFVLVGQGARKQELQQQVQSLGLTNVLFCDYQPLDELSHSLGAADLHLVPLTAELSRCLMPSKLYGILAAGRPFLTNAPESSELHELTMKHNIGFTVKAGSPSEIANKIQSVKAHIQIRVEMGRNGRKLAEDRFTREEAVTAFADVLQGSAKKSARPAN
jgi:glycosyltransferase involved in cell wall biosynthesis